MRGNAARSDALGTMLPRRGFFCGMRAPGYRAAVIEGELPGTSSGSETRIRSWPEPNDYRATQTPSTSALADQLMMAYWSQTGTLVVRSTDVAHAFLSDSDESTDSPWRELRQTLLPLRAVSDALREDIHEAPQGEQDANARARHAGLAAVARLVDVLGLNRPVILRMGGVPASTFYAWQKSPYSIIRTPTVTRLLRLQAQVAILDEALGGDRMRAWILVADRLEKLQGNDAEFAQALAEAQTVLTEATRIRPRPRMRRADYTADPGDMADESVSASPAFPGAAKILEKG